MEHCLKTSEDISIRIATLDDLDDVAPLFDGYRRFYGRESDLAACRSFLRNRLERNESHILISIAAEHAIGFAQLYPTFSSTALARIFILNDLFVAPGARRGGVGSKLLQASAEFARTHGAIRLNLSTALDNHAAQ